MRYKYYRSEFEEHYGTIIMFPSRPDVWRNNAQPMQRYIIELAKTISEFEHVYVFCEKTTINKVSEIANKNITIVESDYDDIWARDICPTFITDKEQISCINWNFNAWGGKRQAAYSPWDKDNSFALQVAKYFGFKCINVPLVLEGGAVLTDGKGTLFTTKSVLCHPSRNPFKSQEYIDKLLKDCLGIDRIIWLEKGLADDETNGHIDNVLTIPKPGEICISWTEDKKNPNYKTVRKIYEKVQSEYGGVIHKLPLPETQTLSILEANGIIKRKTTLERMAGMILPASYVNIYYINGGVIIPSFGVPEDEEAFNIYKSIFPNKQIIQIYSREALIGGGGIHCLLHEIPKI